MKKNQFITVLLALIFYSTTWAQVPTSYGNLNEGNAGNGGDDTNSYFGWQAGNNNTNMGSDNTFIGHLSGQQNTTGDFNTFLGSGSGINNNGSDNVFIGYWSGLNNLNGLSNTFVGTRSGYGNTGGNSNTFLGYYSGFENIDGENNTFIGLGSGYSNDSGSGNVFLGYLAGYFETGSDLLYIDNSNTSSPLIWGNFDDGNEQLRFNGTVSISNIPNDDTLTQVLVTNNNGDINWRDAASFGDSHDFPSYPNSAGNGGGNVNSYFGHEAGLNNTGVNNTFIGYQSGYTNIDGSSNTFIGYHSGYFNDTGYRNTFLGNDSGSSNETGYDNTFLGESSGGLNISGAENTFIGYRAGYNNQSGSGNVFLGYRAGYTETGSDFLYIDNSNTSSPLIWGNFDDGNEQLRFNGTVSISNIPNDDTLTQVLVTNNNGDINWRDAATLGGGGGDNLGNHQVLQDFIPDTDNTYNLGGNGFAFNNIYFDSSLFINDTEFLHTRDNNIAIGTASLTAVAGGIQNVAVGQQALEANTIGEYNTAIGYNALFNNISGSNNTAIGNNARASSNNATNTTAIGNGALALSSNRVTIGNSSVTRIGGFTNWFNFSDGRFKKNVQQDIPGLEFIAQLRPVSYEIDHYKLQAFLGEEQTTTSSQSSKRYVGFIAQEVAQILDENRYTFSGVEHPQNEQDHYGIKYAEFVVPLVKSIQELSAENKEQKQRIETLQQEMETLKNMVYGTVDTAPSIPTESLKEKNNLPKGFVLAQNIPNPFNQTTTITVALPKTVSEAKIVIYSLNGVELQSYPISKRGKTSIEIKGGSLQSGMYLYALLADGQLIDTKKMILTK